MCERHVPAAGIWQGWKELPRPHPSSGRGPWLDLSFPLTESLSRAASFPPPRFERIVSMPEHPLNVTEIQMVCHFGTHVDAPCHFIADGPAAEAIPLDRLHGPGVVWAMTPKADGAIEPEELERAEPALRPGDIVILRTGWSERVNTPAYHDHPWLTAAAAAWLLAHGAKLVAVETISPDLPIARRPPGFSWPVHHTLLAHGVLIAELLNIPASLVGRRVEAMFMALPIVGADGGPARVLARPMD